MTTPEQLLQQQLHVLKQQYRQSLNTELAELKKLFPLSLLSPDNHWQQTLNDAIQRLHRIAGSAGTFGFHQTGTAAKVTERYLTEISDAGLFPDVRQWQYLTLLVSRLAVSDDMVTTESGYTAHHVSSSKDGLVYILESDRLLAEQIKLTLSTFGHRCCHFEHIAELMLALQQQLPDALIIDADLPAGQSLQPLIALQNQLAQAIPLFMIQSYAGFDHYLAAVRAGAIGYFVKPLNTTELEARLQQHLASEQREAFRVLIVDDDELLAKHYALVLESARLRVKVLTEPTRIFAELQQFHPDVIMLDVNMPYCSGPELAQLIRLQHEWLRIPIIYLSSETDSDKQLAALMKAGDDFITKPISDNALVVAVFARAQRARYLSDIITRDGLTGLLHHTHIKERLAAEILRSMRDTQALSVVMLDIDHFKKVNDNYGHLTGDQVIASLAGLLKQQLRRTDLIGRYGGEEFLLILPDCSPEQAVVLMDQIRVKFSGLPFSANEQAFCCTFSAGVCAAYPQQSADEVIEQADQALYRAKTAGRNQVKLMAQDRAIEEK